MGKHKPSSQRHHTSQTSDSKPKAKLPIGRIVAIVITVIVVVSMVLSAILPLISR